MWYLFAILWAILWAFNNTLRKQTADDVDTNLILVYQYLWVVIWSVTVGILYARWMWSDLIPSLNLLQWLGVLSIAMVWYLGIWFFVHALQKEPAAIVALVANTSVFMMFGANRYLFPMWESLSLMRIIVSVLFFVIVAIFMLDTDQHRQNRYDWFNTNLIYPILTALCWTYFFVWNNYIIQYQLLDPIQTVRITELWVWLCALAYYVLRWGTYRWLKDSRSLGRSTTMILLGLTGVSSVVCLYLWYQTISANIVNVIRLSMIMWTALFSRWMLGDGLNRKQIALLCAGFLALLLFVMIP